jgi:hypothetical protein
LARGTWVAQAVFDRVGDRADVRLLQDQRLAAHQPEARRVGVAQVTALHELALVEAAFGVDALLVLAKRPDLGLGQELELGDADAVLPRDHPVEAAGERHDAGDRLVGLLQHLVVVGVDRQVGVHVAVACVHVQRHEHAAAQDLAVQRHAALEDRAEGQAGEDLRQRREQLGLPGHADAPVLQQVEQAQRRVARGADARLVQRRAQAHRLQPRHALGERQVDAGQQELPARAHRPEQLTRLREALLEHLERQPRVGAGLVGLAQRQAQRIAAQPLLERVDDLELVARGQLDVDALDAVGVLGHPRQRDDDVLVDLERVGVPGDRGGPRAIEPEGLARLGRDGHEALAGARVGQAHHLGRGARDRLLVVADDVADQHHLGQPAAARLGRVADRAQVSFVEVLEAGEDRAEGLAVQVVLDLDDGGHRVLGLPEELEADRADLPGHPVQHPARRGDQAVAAFLLNAGQPGEELVGDVLAQALLAKARALDREDLGVHRGATHRAVCGERIGRIAIEAEARDRGVVDLAAVVLQARHLEPVAVGVDHPPPGEIVQRRTPQHRLLAARVHRYVAADARGLERGRVHREHEARAVGRVGDTLGDDPRLREDGRDLGVDAGQALELDRAQPDELLGVDDRRERRERDRAAGVAGAAAARDDGQAELDAAGHHMRDLGLAVGGQHHERVLDAPVGRVGHVRHTRHAVEADVVARGGPRQPAQRACAKIGRLREHRLETRHRFAGEREQPRDLGAACLAGGGVAGALGVAAPLDLAQPVLQRLDQRGAALGVVEQVVLEERVALDHPDVAQHLVEHAGGAAGAALGAQLVDDRPSLVAEHPQHDLAIRERGVVVGNLPQPSGGVC